GCSAMLARPSQLSTSQGTPGTPPERALAVFRVFPDSPAAAAGIKTMDLISQYGDDQIGDDAGFFAARNRYEKSFTSTVEIVVWRGTLRMTVKVPTGWLGVSTIENDAVSRKFSALMMRLNAFQQVPEYRHNDMEFKAQFEGGPAKLLEEAKALIDQAEREGTLTPAQILVDRIYMTLDDAPEEDQRRQSELLKELIATQPVNYIHMLGSDKFFSNKRYRAAIECYKHYLKTSRDDVSIGLDLGVAYNEVGMYDKAEAAADYVFDHKLGLSQFGRRIGYEVKAVAALGRKDYRKSIQFAEKAFASSPDPYDLMLIQVAAAQMGDIEKLEEANQNFQQVLPAKYDGMKLQIDAVEAYGLVKNNQRDAARKLVSRWKDTDRAEGKVIAFFKKVPDGMDVSRNWADLMKN
ncbi:MAG: hypothetical protein ND895_09155, partial [Pyrinomonadaceae bacterium]|nr:hypothetical protein [Pyrinomonadaceae bacterium]